MGWLATMVLPFAACLALAVVTAAAWWRTLHSPWTYLLLSLLSLLGLHRVIQAAAEIVKAVGRSSGYFLIAREDPVKFLQLVEEALTVEAIVVTAVVLAAGYPLLDVLRSLLKAA